jgi:ribosomal protein S18 acetylase RimI-like enzyme
MKIRKMLITDYDEIYALWISCKGIGLNNIDDSKKGIERFLRRNPDTCLVAEEYEKIVGIIMVGNDGRRGYIYHTVVDTVSRNKKVGATLVQEVLQALKELGISKVALVVFERNEGGNTFWEKQGFTVREDLIYRNKTITEMVRIDT